MHLKSIQMVGFKSFASKTKIELEPGMTAIVGPNGCGKSNVSDAIRWVIGEQSAKAMRGSKMTDCIFGGTDDRKPLGMAEVIVIFAGCEGILNTEYDEVTISRRVFQSGEGQYLINRTPCRLKDVQRLFMDTGIGTSSYSFMQQGRIDQILSSRPEDRRELFEEASGITKYKADKREAIRKLEHTEANLLRLADVIREVKRQIGSLQRQAGKARRYKAFSEELRRLDIYATRERLKTVDREIAKLKAFFSRAEEDLAAEQREVNAMESGNSVLRESLVHTEREIGSALESAVQAQSNLDHTHDLIRMNQKRIEEYRAWSERDTRQIDETRKQVVEHTKRRETFTQHIEEVTAEKQQTAQELKASTDRFAEHQEQIDASRTGIQQLREESVELESLVSRLQNQLVELESRERSAVIQRERLAAEKAQLARVAQAYAERQDGMDQALASMRNEVAESARLFDSLEQQKTQASHRIRNLQHEHATLQSQSAAQQMKLGMLQEQGASGEGFPAGARLLLDDTNPLGVDKDRILGTLVALIEVDDGYRRAVEAALRSWLDAVVVGNRTSALDMLQLLERRKEGAARLVPADVEPGRVALGDDVDTLLSHIRCPERVTPIIRALVGHVAVVDSLDALPSSSLPAGAAAVTRSGSLAHGNGCLEYWTSDSQTATPLSRKHLISEAETCVASTEKRTAENREQSAVTQATVDSLEEKVSRCREGLDTRNRTLAQKEGETQVITREATEARDRLETVTWELDDLVTQNESGASEKDAIAARLVEVREQRNRITSDISSQNQELQKIENRHGEWQSELTERRVRHAEVSHRAINLTHQHDAAASRLKELEAAVAGRSEGIQSYEAGIESLTESIAECENQIKVFERSVTEHNARADSLRKNREKQSSELKAMETALVDTRQRLEETREQRSSLEVRLTENQIRRQNQVDRTTAEYKITFEQLQEEPDPEWKDEQPGVEAVETRIEELRTKLEAMGPVNLVAIDEHKELEERYTFLTAQEQDLVKAKQQLMEMIRKINRTTTEMFSTTFDKVNEDFQVMFRKLFNGGNAKLVLVDEEDVLECGIEIIARPPGKRLQNVSLLSGGERTLTAVALLFAIYMIKPSPFCMLDELDAALDDANIGRFVGMLKSFQSQSQFVVITHNRQTIAAANVIYGITMPEKGVSRIVSMKFSDQKKAPSKEMAQA